MFIYNYKTYFLVKLHFQTHLQVAHSYKFHCLIELHIVILKNTKFHVLYFILLSRPSVNKRGFRKPSKRITLTALETTIKQIENTYLKAIVRKGVLPKANNKM